MARITDKLFSLEGKTALVTGAGGAIGRVLAKALAESGAKVAIHDFNDERLAVAKAYIEESGVEVLTLKADLTDAKACRSLVDEAHEKLGRLDILLNSAGVNRRKPILEVTPEDFDAIIDVNLRSIYFLSQAAQPHMAAQGGGKIVNISSLSAKHAFNTISVYAASKAGVSQLTKAMAREWVGDNIQVNAIEPGFVKTEFTRPLWDDEYRSEWFRRFIPTGRLANPEELIGATLLLASPASSYITGQAIVVDGGVLTGATWVKPE
ncbi:SDR family NAD(P)-dependent oxidoreductase [Kaistia nematophila]|uniref:Glucose 1-dehydrogenase n=1 Tax=Kaistia nematophila TaxID=2994654 RepID=A0A9X3E1Y8_9HYPH|nr:glucose 1-dehydrogenase [Kaistia nematophila]MCX5570189.1 glucose 1-dehydrogenase [Kaistia nematophila]